MYRSYDSCVLWVVSRDIRNVLSVHYGFHAQMAGFSRRGHASYFSVPLLVHQGAPNSLIPARHTIRPSAQDWIEQSLRFMVLNPGARRCNTKSWGVLAVAQLGFPTSVDEVAGYVVGKVVGEGGVSHVRSPSILGSSTHCCVLPSSPPTLYHV